MDDETLDFAAFMEKAGMPASKLEAVAKDEAKPGDDSALVFQSVITIGQMRLLRDAFGHVYDHGCEWGASVLVSWAAAGLTIFDPFLQELDAEGDALDSSGRSHLCANEEGDERPDGSVEGSD